MCDGEDIVFCRLWKLFLRYGETRIGLMILIFRDLFVGYIGR